MARSNPTQGSEPFRLENSPSHLLHRAEQLAADRFSQLVGEDVCTLRQFAVLAAIAEEPGLSQSELVKATGVDRSTLADMMNRMESRGWVTRTPSKSDARALSIRLADTGTTILAAATQFAIAADAAILDLMSAPKRKSFMSALSKLIRTADEATEKAEKEARKRQEKAKQQKRRQVEKERAQKRRQEQKARRQERRRAQESAAGQTRTTPKREKAARDKGKRDVSRKG